MKSSTKVLLYIAPLLFAASALSQVDVTATGGTANASYATLKEAFDAINAGTHTDVITIGISGNTTETATAALNASGSGSASYTSISITPTGGATRTITGGIAEGSPLIDFNGADNVTIDGLSSSGNALTIANTTVAATSGTSTIRFINDATNNVITNCSIQGSATMGTTTNGGVMFFSTAASGGNGNDNNTISDCSIGPAGVNLPSKGIYGSGSTTTTAANNSSITISGNRIFDFFSPSTSNAGIYVTSGNTDWSISNNKFYQTGTRTWTTGSSHRVIEISNTSGNNFQVTNNTIGFSSAAGTGTYTLTGSTNTFRAISLNVGTTTASSVQGNTITAISHTTTTSGTTSSSPCMMIFVSSSGLVNIGNSAGNTIGSQDGSTNISFTSSSTSTSDVYGIHNFSLSSTNISSNSIGSITVSNSSTGSVVFFGIRVNTSSTAGITSTILNNVVGNSVGVITNNAAGSFSSRLIGIQNDRAQPTITGNTVRNMIISAPNTNSGTSAAVLGIYNAATANGGVTISHNVIHSLSYTGSAGGAVAGLNYNGPTSGTNTVDRNFIHSLSSSYNTSQVDGIKVTGGTTTYSNNMIRLGIDASGNSLTADLMICGINETVAGTDNFYFNSVYIGGTRPSGGGFDYSYAFQSSITTNTRNIQNNIFVNMRSSPTSAAYRAIRVGGSSSNPAGLTINNNIYSVKPGNEFGFFNFGVVASLAAWKTRVGQDANSLEYDPLFSNPTGTSATVNLHMGTNTPAEATGVDIPSVTQDFDGEARASLTPVDIGADAGNFVEGIPPALTYTALLHTTSTSNRTLTATMTDAAGIASGVNAPRLYFRKGASGSFAFVNATSISGNDYTFTVDYSLIGEILSGDFIQYYVATQDNLGNLTTLPSGGAGVNPPGTAAPAVPNQYQIYKIVSSFPYSENLEGISTGFFSEAVSGSFNDWVLGTPAKTQIAGPHSGTKAFVTLTSGNYSNNQDAAIYSPSFDFSALGSDPTLSFWQNFKYDGSTDDVSVLEYSTDGGSVWRRADSTRGTGLTYNTPISTGWYNYLSYYSSPNKGYVWAYNPSTSYAGQAAGWIQSTTLLTGFAGKPDARFRWRFNSDSYGQNEGWAIDDISIVIGIDIVAPVIVYTAFGYGSTSNLALNGFATIVDNVGVSSGASAPRFYYKKSTDADAFVGNTSSDNGWKYVVASNASSPYSFTVDYSIIFGGSVAVDDIVQYFVVAQDDANNLGSTPGGAGASAIPPIQNINSKPPTINAFVIKSALSGTKNIPGDYATLTGAGGLFADINAKLLDGNMIVNIMADLTEDGTNALVQWHEAGTGGYTLTLRPDGPTERLISGSVANGMIRLDSADRVMIDGRSGGVGKYLRFRNTNASGRTIDLWYGVVNDTIRNCYIEGAGSSVVSLSWGNYLMPPGVGTGIAVTDCQVRDLSNGVGVPGTLIYLYSGGSSSTVTVSNNELFNFTTAGVNFSGLGSSWAITGNTIYQTSTRTTNLVGVSLSAYSGGSHTISQNTIRDLATTGTTTGIGINFSNTYSQANVTVSGNRIYGFPSAAGSTSNITGISLTTQNNATLSGNQISLIPSNVNNQSIIGISCSGDHATVYLTYNSVLIGGSATGSTSTYGIQTSSSGSLILYNMFSNILINKREGGSGNHGAVRHISSAYVGYNLYAGTGATPANFMDLGTPRTFDQWVTTMSDVTSYGTEAVNINASNLFVDPTNGDLHINPANAECWLANGKGGGGGDIGAFTVTPDAGVVPPSATESAPPAQSTTTTYKVNGRTLGEIAWGATGTPPSSVNFKYYSSVPPPGAVNTNINSYWDIVATGGSGYSYDITLHYTEAELNGIPELSLVVGKTDETNAWRNIGGVPNSTANTVIAFGVNSFSKFTLTDGNNPLPVQIASFTATEIPNRGVRLQWTTLSEINNYGFEVQRKAEGTEQFVDLPNSFVAGHGTTNEPHRYQFSDSTVARGSWSYRLKQLDLDGTIHFTDAIHVSVLTDVREIAPMEFALFQNYPNPFNPSTTIKFSVEKTDRATIEVYNILGQHVGMLFDEIAEAGQFYRVKFDGTNLASGMYIYRLQSGARSQLRKLLLLK